MASCNGFLEVIPGSDDFNINNNNRWFNGFLEVMTST